MEENKIGHIYTAKLSKSGQYVNLTIVYGDDKDNRKFICVPVRRLDSGDATEYKGKKPFAIKCEAENVAYIEVPLIEAKEAEAKQEAVKAKADEMPF